MTFDRTMLVLLLLMMVLAPGAMAADAAPRRHLLICVGDDAPQGVRDAAQRLLDAAGTHPLLHAMAGDELPSKLSDTGDVIAGNLANRAYNHLVVVGLMNDALVQMLWQREARIENGSIYAFGFGHLSGDLGYIESDRNPFLHGAAVKAAPYEAEIITITGTTPAGVIAAADALLDRNIVNGVVAPGAWSRAKPCLLEHAPLTASMSLPSWLPRQIGPWTQIGTTQPGEDEFRGVLADTGVSPAIMWRVKYYRPGAWDRAGAANAIEMYMAGLHRRAYANSLWLAQFASPEQAAAARPLIQNKAHTPVVQRDSWLVMGNVPGIDLAREVNQPQFGK